MTTSTSDPTHSTSVAFIGGGNMARSLIGGLIARGTPANAIHVAEPVAELRASLVADFGVQVFADGSEAVAGTDVWVLAVKPQVMRTVCESVAVRAQAEKPVAISIAAGITTTQLQRWLGGDVPVVRAMPNTPALLGAGATGLFASPQVDADGRARAQHLLDSAGVTVWVDDESLIGAVTAASGSAPAYVFLLAEAMQDAAIAQGLPEESARTLVLQTILGAARMLTEGDVEASELRRRVTSPNGTTHAAIETFEAGGLRDLVARAMHAARDRGEELSAAND